MKEVVLIFITFSLVTAHVTGHSPKIIPGSKTASQPTISDVIRIVGGNEAVPNSIPYQVALNLIFNSTRSFCGGCLITTKHVLTAAHCLNDGLVSLEVILGAHNISRNESTQQIIRTSSFKMHENFSVSTFQQDIGMVYLPTAATLNEFVQLIPLPSKADVSNSYVGSAARISGWGYTSETAGDVSPILRYVNVTIISNDVCVAAYNTTFVTDSIICSGGTGNIGACYGDSGGPLVINGKLIGVTIYVGDNGCDDGEPTGFSRVTSFLDWIAANSDVVIS